MAKKLKVTALNGESQYAPASRLNMQNIPRQNSLLRAEKRKRIELVDVTVLDKTGQESEELLEVIDEGSPVIGMNETIDTVKSQSARIAELEAQLAALQTAPLAPEPEAETTMTAVEMIKAIKGAGTVEDVNAMTQGETRKTVLDAAKARIAELTA